MPSCSICSTRRRRRCTTVGGSPPVIASTLATFLGQPASAVVPFQAETLEETEAGSHVRRRLRFRAATGEWIPAYLLVPNPPARRTTPMPAVLCPHQTTQEGKREPVGARGQSRTGHGAPTGGPWFRDADMGRARALANVTIQPPVITATRSRSTPRIHSWSLLGKMIADLSRAIDYLATLPFIDRARIGCVGHSHGGITTLFGMALEPRLAAGASNCGFDTFRIDGNVWRWSHATALLPGLGFYATQPVPEHGSLSRDTGL